MTIEQVKNYFKDKEHASCPLTERLVKAGYQQRGGGYIDRAKKKGVKVNYKENSPSQYWHLMTYCNSRDGNKPFSKRVVCGELIFWMAEVSGCVLKSDLRDLQERVIKSGSPSKEGRPLYDRIKWNKEIQDLCFDEIEARVCAHINNLETIFDHNVTKEEIRKLFGNPEITKEELLSFELSQNQHYLGIFKLYSIRKDKVKAKEYFDKLPNTLTKRFTLCHRPPIF